MPDGLFITVEGPDGAGKSSQATLLADHIRGLGRTVVLTREPGGTRVGEGVRGVLLDREGEGHTAVSDALLYNAARHHSVIEVIRPALARGDVVISDRYADSTLAYQGHGAGVPLATLEALAEAATGGLRPDLTIVLDLPVEVGLARKTPEDVTRFEAEFDLPFHRRVRDGFLAIAAAEPARVAVVDATASEEDVAAEIVALVHRRLGDGEPERLAQRTTP
jgi:dTMP kinase